MLKISMFMLCDSIAPGTPIPQLIGPQAVLRPSFIPGNFSFGLAAAVTGINVLQPHTFSFSISNPQKKIVQHSPSQQLPIELNIEKNPLPEKYQGIMVAMDIRNLLIEEEGEYIFTIYIDDENASYSFPIYKKYSHE